MLNVGLHCVSIVFPVQRCVEKFDTKFWIPRFMMLHSNRVTGVRQILEVTRAQSHVYGPYVYYYHRPHDGNLNNTAVPIKAISKVDNVGRRVLSIFIRDDQELIDEEHEDFNRCVRLWSRHAEENRGGRAVSKVDSICHVTKVYDMAVIEYFVMNRFDNPITEERVNRNYAGSSVGDVSNNSARDRERGNTNADESRALEQLRRA